MNLEDQGDQGDQDILEELKTLDENNLLLGEEIAPKVFISTTYNSIVIKINVTMDEIKYATIASTLKVGPKVYGYIEHANTITKEILTKEQQRIKANNYSIKNGYISRNIVDIGEIKTEIIKNINLYLIMERIYGFSPSNENLQLYIDNIYDEYLL